MDRLWVLDAGRPSTPSGSGVLATHGGVKLIGIDLSTNTVFTTIVFPATVAYSDSVSLPLIHAYLSMFILFANRTSTTSVLIYVQAPQLQAKALHTSLTPAPKAAMGLSSLTSVPESPGAIWTTPFRCMQSGSPSLLFGAKRCIPLLASVFQSLVSFMVQTARTALLSLRTAKCYTGQLLGQDTYTASQPRFCAITRPYRSCWRKHLSFLMV